MRRLVPLAACRDLLLGSLTVTLRCVSSGEEAVSREAAAPPARPVLRDDMAVPESSFSLVSAHLAWTEITSLALAAADRRGREDMLKMREMMEMMETSRLHWQIPRVRLSG